MKNLCVALINFSMSNKSHFIEREKSQESKTKNKVLLNKKNGRKMKKV